MEDHGGSPQLPARDRRPRKELAILRKLANLAAVLVLAGLAFVLYGERRFRDLRETLEAEISTYKRQRWERPTLRGSVEEGNAAIAGQQALAGFRGLKPEPREQLASQLHYGQPLGAEQLQLLDAHAAMIAGLRKSTQRGFAMTEIAAEQGARAQVPPYPLVIDAVLILLAHAARSAPDECLLIAADAMRFGQDLVPGAPLEAASVAMRITSLATPVVQRCAALASNEGVPRAARELNTLATHAPSPGSGIELADITAQVELLRLAELFPDQSSDSFITRVRRRPALFEAFARFEQPTRWRELAPERYPEALEGWQREHDWRARSELQLVADASSQVQGWLYDDMRGQALLRALTVGLATLTERLRQRRTPHEPIGLSDPALRDPFNAQPLKWRLSQDGRELSLWSVGEDRRDDKGSSEWTAQAPIDVVVHFALKPFEDAESTRRSARR